MLSAAAGHFVQVRAPNSDISGNPGTKLQAMVHAMHYNDGKARLKWVCPCSPTKTLLSLQSQ